MLTTSDHDRVRVVTVDHGKVNALDLELLTALIDSFERADPEQPVVLTGAGRAFSAGVDLRRIVEGGAGYVSEFLDALSRSILAVYRHSAPVVAAINGAAIAGGCVIAAACDLRVMSGGPIGLAELAVGVPFPTAALEVMRGLVGPRLNDLVLSATTLSAQDALVYGLVDEVAAPEALLARALQRAQSLGGLPSGVFRHTKRQLQRPTLDRIAAAAGDDRHATDLWSSGPVLDAVSTYLANIAVRPNREVGRQ